MFVSNRIIMPRKKAFDEVDVLNKAIEVFWEKGYNGASYSDLVGRMGINRASMYDTFGDKQQLYLKALKQYRKNNANPIRSLLASKQNALEKINVLLDMAIHDCRQGKDCKGCFIVNATTELADKEPEIAKELEMNREQMEALFGLVLEQGQQEGSITKDQPVLALARFIYNTHFGMQALARSNPDPKVLEDIKGVALQALRSLQ